MKKDDDVGDDDDLKDEIGCMQNLQMVYMGFYCVVSVTIGFNWVKCSWIVLKVVFFLHVWLCIHGLLLGCRESGVTAHVIPGNPTAEKFH